MTHKLNEEQFANWCQSRHKELSAPDSWLGLIGLFWLEPGVNAVGSSADAAIRLPDGAAHAGDVLWNDAQLFWQPAGEAAIELTTDRNGSPTMVSVGALYFFVADRDGRLAVRLRDPQWATRTPFAGVDYFPYNAGWRIEAAWQTLSPPLTMEVPNVTGDLKTVEVRHQALFEAEGQHVTLLPMSVDDDKVFFVFRDRTSGKESYGAGRFLNAPAALDGRITLDFNFAYNPPCAFTPFATCPLPPPENWLPFAVAAGEKKFGKQLTTESTEKKYK